ncbi:hypothetical protein BDZ91DRAFT_850768 [Kalaharituber pfeilii]|nr:hypothetical protein BDZ91DRAFT_850768 [Kalaharituber pfeilii]
MDTQLPGDSTSTAEDWEPAVWNILASIRDHGMDIATFFERVMKSSTPRLKQKAGVFFAKDGFQRVFEAMPPHMEFDPKKRSLNASRSVIELKQRMGLSLGKLVHVVLESELRAYCSNAESRMGVGNITPEVAKTVTFEKLKQNFEECCPRLSGIVQAVCQGNGSGRDEKDDSDRNREVICTVVLCMMGFARSRRSNRLQTLVGYYLQANTVSRQAIGFLNHIGLSVSYSSICESMKSMGSANLKLIRKRIWEGEPFGWMWDNMTIAQNKTEQSIANRKGLTQYTACALWFLHIPKPEAGSEYEEVYAELMSKSAQGSPPGMDMKLLKKTVINYEGIDRLWLLSMQSYAEYMPYRMVVHLSDVLWKFFGDVLKAKVSQAKKDKRAYSARPEFEKIYQIPLMKSEVHALSSLELDETSIEGTAQILDALHRETEMTVESFLGRAVVHAGDLGTLMKVETLKQLRMREFVHNRHNHLVRHEGLFHMEMAAEDMLFRAHWGREDGMDPGSLCHLKHVLGLKGINGEMPEYNACRRFTRTCGEGFILAAICTEARVENIGELRAKLGEGLDYVNVCQAVVRRLCTPRTVSILRERAENIARESWAEMMKTKKKTERVGDELNKKAFLKRVALENRDVVYENFVLYLQHYLVVRDFHYNISVGDSGAVLKDIEPLAVWFAGSGKGHYAKATTNLLLDNAVVWTPHMRYEWLNNILLNLSGRPGKYMGIDKVNEIVVRKVKDQHNPRSAWQSKDFFLNSVSQNAFMFNEVKKAMNNGAHVPHYGTKHGVVEDKNDIELVVDILLQGEILEYKKVDKIIEERLGGLIGDDSDEEIDDYLREEIEAELEYRAQEGSGDGNQDLTMEDEQATGGALDQREQRDDVDVEDDDLDYGDILYSQTDRREPWRDGDHFELEMEDHELEDLMDYVDSEDEGTQ